MIDIDVGWCWMIDGWMTYSRFSDLSWRCDLQCHIEIICCNSVSSTLRRIQFLLPEGWLHSFKLPLSCDFIPGGWMPTSQLITWPKRSTVVEVACRHGTPPLFITVRPCSIAPSRPSMPPTGGTLSVSGSPKNIRRICLLFLHVLHVEYVCFMIFMSLFCWSFDGSGQESSDFWPPRYDEAILGTAPVRVRCFHGAMSAVRLTGQCLKLLLMLMFGSADTNLVCFCWVFCSVFQVICVWADFRPGRSHALCGWTWQSSLYGVHSGQSRWSPDTEFSICFHWGL